MTTQPKWLLKNAIIETLSSTALSGAESGQSIALTGQYFDTDATAQFKKISDGTLTNATITVTDEQNASVTTTQAYEGSGAYKLIYTNPNGSTFVPSSSITIGLPEIVLYLSDGIGGSGDVTNVTGGWTASSYNHSSSNVHDVSTNRMRLDISGSGSTAYLIGSALRTTNAIVIPEGYNRIEVKYGPMVGSSGFRLSSTPPSVVQGNGYSNYNGGFAEGHSTSNSTDTIVIDESIANGSGWYFYFAATGGQNANVDFEVTSIKVLAV